MSQKKIGAKIVIDGEQEFRSALQQSKNALKEFDSELKLVSAQFKNNERSMDALKAKQAVYQKQQQELAKQSKILVEQIKKANEAYKKAEDAQTKQVEKIRRIEQALEKAKKEYGDSSDEVKELERELSDANDEYEKQERQITSLSNKITKWNTDLNKTQTELVQTDRALDETNEAIENFDEGMEDAESETKKFGITMNNASEGTDKLKVSLGSLVSAQVVVDVLRNCARAIKEVAEAALDVGMKFESSMSNVEALSGASGDSLERLAEKAKEMGSQTIYSASESADALSYMALAGWNVEQMLEGIEPVLSLAAAANMDLAEASDIVTDYITAFGLKAEDAAHFSDAMATAMSTSNTTVELLAESYKNCAATCGSMGIAMEDATAVLATMANAGVKGGEAGTALNTILTRIATNTKGAADALKKYGIDVYDPVSGNMNELSSILNGLGDIWGDLSDKEQAALAKTVAGVSQYSRFQTIMLGVSKAAKEGGQSFDDYAKALRNCDGAAEAMAKTMQDNLAGDITILKSALEGLGIATEGVFDDAFRTAVQGATDSVSRLERAVSKGDLGVSLAALGDSVAKLTEDLMQSAEDALPGFIDGLTWMINNIDYLNAGIQTAVVGFASYKIATLAATVATEGFTVALNLNPIGLLATAIAATVAGLAAYAHAEHEAANATTESTRATNAFLEKQQGVIDSLDDSAQKRADEITTMDAQAAAAKRLVAELFNENTSQERRALVVSQLKEIYPQLNVAVDEHGKIIGASKEKIDQYIESSLKLAKVEAAREHLSEIAADQFKAEIALEETKAEVRKKSAETRELYTKKFAEGNKQIIETTEGAVSVLTQEGRTAVAAYNQSKNGLNELIDKQKEEKEKVEELGEEYNRTMEYINNNAPIDEAAASMDEMARAEAEVVTITEDMQKEFDDLYDAIQKSVSSSLDLTKKWSQDWSTSTTDMTENVKSQIEGIQNWSENFDTLANNAEVQIDQRVMKYLADMGTEGAGLVQQLVDTLKASPEELEEWSSTMAQYLTLEDSVAAEITESYKTCVLEGVRGAAEAISTNNELTEATDALAEDFGESMKEVGTTGATALQEGFEEASGDVSDSAKELGESVVKGITDQTGEKGEKIGKIGEDSDEALAEALENGKAVEAARTAAQTMYENMNTILSEDAGYGIGERFMGGLGSAIDALGEQVIAAAQAAADEARRILNSIPQGPGGGGGPEIPGHALGLDYVPYDNYIARLHEGERVLTKEENAEYTALVGAAKAPSFDYIQSKYGAGQEPNAVVINNDIKVDGAQDPEAWTQTFIRTLKREARMA